MNEPPNGILTNDILSSPDERSNLYLISICFLHSWNFKGAMVSELDSV